MILEFQIFCSFGNAYRLTNNNTYKQIILAGADKLSKLYNPKVGTIYDDLHPSVLRLLSFSMSKAAEKNLEIEVCGELASRQLAIPILLSLGVKGLSVNYNVVGVVKYTIQGISLKEIRTQILSQILNSNSGKDVKEILRQYLSLKGLSLIE